jgi:O-antigen/teichoic acid export membrane protein
MACFIMCFVSFFFGLIEYFIGIPLIFVYYAVIACALNVFFGVMQNVWRLEEKVYKFGTYSLIAAGLRFFFTFLLVIGFRKGWTGCVYAQLLVTGTLCLISIKTLYDQSLLRIVHIKRSLFIDILVYSLPFVPNAVSFWLKQGLDRYIVNYFHNSTAVGIYSFALNLTAIISLFGTAFNNSNSVYIFKQLANGYEQARPSLVRINKLMCIVFGGVFVITWLGLTIGIPIFFPNYRCSIPYLFPVCLSAFFNNIYLLYMNYLWFYKKTKLLMYITFSTGILQMVLSIWLTRYNILYTAYISCFISLLSMFLVRYSSLRLLKKIGEKL